MTCLPLLLKNDDDGCAADVLKLRACVAMPVAHAVAVVGGFKNDAVAVREKIIFGFGAFLFGFIFFSSSFFFGERQVDKTPEIFYVSSSSSLLLFQVLSSSRMVDDDENDDDKKDDEMAMERAPPTVPQVRQRVRRLSRPPPLLRPFAAQTRHHIEKFPGGDVAKNGVEFEEMMRQKRMEMFWWLEDKSSREYGMYKRLLESKIGIPKRMHVFLEHAWSTTTATMSHEHQHQRQQTNNDANHVQAQIEAAKMKAQKMLTEEKEKAKKVLEYVEDTSLFDIRVVHVPKRHKTNAGFQNGTYNAIDVLTAPKNVNEELIQRKSKVEKNTSKKEWNYSSTS